MPRKRQRKKGPRRKGSTRGRSRRSPPRRRPDFQLPEPPWVKDTSLPCPCGSRRTYSECCMERIPQLGPGLTKLADADETTVRAELTRYLGWVYEHTLPVLASAPLAPARDMADVDVGALVGLAEGLAFCLAESGRDQDALEVFSQVGSAVPLPALDEAMLALEIAWLWFRLERPDDARRLLDSVPDILAARHAPLIEVYLDFYSDLPITRQVPLIDRILQLRNRGPLRDETVLLHYIGGRATMALLLGDESKASELLEHGARAYLPRVSKKEDVFSLNVCAHVHELRWRLKGSDGDFSAAVAYHERVLSFPGLSPTGLARSHFEVGMLCLDNRLYEQAILHFEESLRHRPYQPAAIHLAEAYLCMGRVKDGEALLGKLPGEPIAERHRLEFLGAQAMLATRKSDPSMARIVLGELGSLDLPDLYFQRTRDKLCLALTQFVTSEEPVKQARQASTMIERILSALRHVWASVELKPNFLGFGVDLKKLPRGGKGRNDVEGS